MSAQPNDGGPAFPLLQNNVFGGVTTAGGGMSLRDYFAAKAMQVHCHALGPANLPPDEWHREVARVAYMTADAMLKARGETP